MLLTKGKSVIFTVLSLLFFSLVYTQESELYTENTLLYHKEIQLSDQTLYLPIYKENLRNTVDINNNNKEELSIYNTKWNTSVFNAYWNKKPSFPIDLHFDEKTFSSPVTHKMVITSRYGWRNGRPHQGIDVDLQTGDLVKTILAGKVRYAHRHGGHGKTIIVRHNNGLETVYAHLSEYLVEENQIVEKGQVIGKGGISGNARGSHLHLEIRYQGKSIHPEYLFEFDETTKIRAQDIVITEEWGTPRLHKSNKKSNIRVAKAYKVATAANTSNSDKKIYIVKKGDTLYRIANEYQLKVSEICEINSLADNAILNIGQEIILH